MNIVPSNSVTDSSPDFPFEVCHEIWEKVERTRSLVLRNLKESSCVAPQGSADYDFFHARQILNCVGVDCCPVSVYRLGRFVPNKHRLVKVVLPASKFQQIALRNSHNLQNTCYRDVFVRPSLPPEERNQLSRSNSHPTRNLSSLPPVKFFSGSTGASNVHLNQ